LARALSTCFVGAIAVFMALRAHEAGITAALISFVLGAASFGLGEWWLGRPGEASRMHYGWAALGAALATGIVSAGSGLGWADLPFIVGAACASFATGLFLVVTVTGWPRAT